MAQRWLILTSSTGSGHDTRAYALRAWARQCYGEHVAVTVWHALEESSRLGRFGVWLYNTIQRQWPGLHQIYWQVAEAWGWLQRLGTPFGGGAVDRQLQALRPHLVISMHDSLNAPYFARARRVLGRERVRCVTYCGEWSPGFGFSRHWIDPQVDAFYTRTQAVADYARTRGVAADRARVFRDLLRPSDYEAAWPQAKVARFRRETLALQPDRFTVLLASGALGADRHHRMLAALLPLADRVQAIALCGRNERARERTEAWARAHPELPVAVQGFTPEVYKLFLAADGIVTRGGSNTMAEAVFHRLPVLFHAERGIMPQELCTRRFLEDEGIGFFLASPEELTARVRLWLEHPERLERVRRRLVALPGGEHPRAFVEGLHALAEEVV